MQWDVKKCTEVSMKDGVHLYPEPPAGSFQQ